MADDPDEANAGTPPLLSYRAPRDERRQWPARVQAMVGFVLAGGTSAVFNLAGGIFAVTVNPYPRPDSFPVTWRFLITLGIVLVPLLFFGAIGISLRRRGVWPAFLPGVLAGWGGAALAEGLCFLSYLR